jgi:hypothetical protein
MERIREIKWVAFIMILIFTDNLSGQAIEFVQHGRFSVVPNFSVDACYRTLRKNSDDPSLDILIQSRNDREDVKIGYTAGINLCYKIRESAGLETGLQYSNKGFQTAVSPLHFMQQGPNDPVNSKFIYYFNYLDIPFKVNLVFGPKKVKLYTSAGLVTNILLGSGVISVLGFSDGHNETKKQPNTFYNYNKVAVSSSFSAGADIRISEKKCLRIGPELRHSLIPTLDAPLNEYLWSLGLLTALYIDL